MVEIGERPKVMWRVMPSYAAFGFTDHIACGYRGEVIKKYFAELDCFHAQDLIVTLNSG